MHIFKIFIFLLTCMCSYDLDTKEDSKTQLITEQSKLKINKNSRNAENFDEESSESEQKCGKILFNCCYCGVFKCFSHIANCFCCFRKCYQDK